MRWTGICVCRKSSGSATRLDHIRQVAWHHVLPPDLVLNAALTKLSACMPPTVRIDTGVLNPVPLHHNGSITGPSGAGKSSMCDVGAECVELQQSRA